jgi:predicted nucleic acid-binding Zn ribbon protein
VRFLTVLLQRNSGETMPIYVYKNLKTGETFEYEQRITEGALSSHPETGDPVKRLIQPVGIAFKGSGFYVNDSRNGSSSSKKPDTKSDGTPSESTSADSSKTETTKAETKTETKAESKAEAKPKTESKPAAKAASSSAN